MSKVLLATAVVVAFLSPAQAAAKKAKTPEQACQPPDRTDARPRRAAIAARPRRGGDRVIE